MGLRINTNVQSLRAQQSLGKVTREQEDSLAKMSSGTRINKAADDAAGLAISERLKQKSVVLNKLRETSRTGSV